MDELFEESDDDFVEEAPQPRSKKPAAKKIKPTMLRIVAGALRRRRIVYNGNPETRPMKEKTREAVFSVLGGYLDDQYAIDLFGGTGILAFESVSRGCVGATVLELSRPAINTMLENMKVLNLNDLIEVQNVDTLRWLKSAEGQTRRLPNVPWVIFCCPPYAMWRNDGQRLVEGLQQLMAVAPEGSRLVCETELDYPLAGQMPEYEWDLRKYKPAMVGFAQKPFSDEATSLG